MLGDVCGLCAQAPADGGWMRGEREEGGADVEAVCVCVCVYVCGC